jgi:hypothetical protein
VLPSEATGLSALTALTYFGTTAHWTAPLASPPFFMAMPSLKELDLTSCECLVITRAWNLPALTKLSLSLSPASALLPAALPALRELNVTFPLAPDDLPPLPFSLTSLLLSLDASGANIDPARPRFTADRVLRWTDASPLSACPALSSLSVSFAPHRLEGPGQYYVSVPQTLSETLDELYVKTCTDGGATGIIRVPAALRERLTAPGALELNASEVVFME